MTYQKLKYHFYLTRTSCFMSLFIYELTFKVVTIQLYFIFLLLFDPMVVQGGGVLNFCLLKLNDGCKLQPRASGTVYQQGVEEET